VYKEHCSTVDCSQGRSKKSQLPHLDFLYVENITKSFPLVATLPDLTAKIPPNSTSLGLRGSLEHSSRPLTAGLRGWKERKKENGGRKGVLLPSLDLASGQFCDNLFGLFYGYTKQGE